MKTYQVWNGDFWTFERIVEDLSQLVRSIVAKTTPESCIDDCMQDAWLKLLVDLESVAEGASYTPIKDLRRPELVQLCARIMACEAQHWTVLSGLRNPGEYVKAVPWPYVYGSK